MARRTQLDARYHRAKKEGYAARSVYKLQDMDRRYGLLKRGQCVLDLGCHPGSWLQYAAQAVGAQGRVLGVDLKPPTVDLPPWVSFLECDVLALTPAMLELGGKPAEFDLVLSDLAPATTGVPHADMAASHDLTAKAVDLALATLKPGGSLVAKVFQGPGFDELVARVRSGFKLGKAHKPPGSKPSSREIYLLGRQLKARAN